MVRHGIYRIRIARPKPGGDGVQARSGRHGNDLMSTEHARDGVAPARVVGESLVIPRDREHVVVSAQDPAAEDDASVHRAVLAKPRVHGVGVLDGALAQRVVARAVAHTLGDARRERAIAAPLIMLRRGGVAAIHRSGRTSSLASFAGEWRNALSIVCERARGGEWRARPALRRRARPHDSRHRQLAKACNRLARARNQDARPRSFRSARSFTAAVRPD